MPYFQCLEYHATPSIKTSFSSKLQQKKARLMYVTRSLSFHIIIIFVLGAVHKGHHHLKKIIKFLWNFFQILSQKRFFSNFIGKGCNLGNSDVLIRGNFWIEDIGEEGVKKTGKKWWRPLWTAHKELFIRYYLGK